MVMPKKNNCRCGVRKTTENTSTRIIDGNIVYYYLCKVCDAAYKKKKRFATMSKEELTALLQVHLSRAEDVKEELSSRKRNVIKKN